jgi:hypothetical protein
MDRSLPDPWESVSDFLRIILKHRLNTEKLENELVSLNSTLDSIMASITDEKNVQKEETDRLGVLVRFASLLEAQVAEAKIRTEDLDERLSIVEQSASQDVIVATLQELKQRREGERFRVARHNERKRMELAQKKLKIDELLRDITALQVSAQKLRRAQRRTTLSEYMLSNSTSESVRERKEATFLNQRAWLMALKEREDAGACDEELFREFSASPMTTLLGDKGAAAAIAQRRENNKLLRRVRDFSPVPDPLMALRERIVDDEIFDVEAIRASGDAMEAKVKEGISELESARAVHRNRVLFRKYSSTLSSLENKEATKMEMRRGTSLHGTEPTDQKNTERTSPVTTLKYHRFLEDLGRNAVSPAA